MADCPDGRLTITLDLGIVRGRRHVQCVCVCGNIWKGPLNNLKTGVTRSCGCLRKEQLAARSRRHGLANKCPEYRAWKLMIGRCHNANCPKFADYGGRGIAVCAEWRTDFAAFLQHIGPRPSPKHSVGRINNEKGYEPGNVRWETQAEQMRNTRVNHHLTFQGVTFCIEDWAKWLGHSSSNAIHARLKSGWTVERTLTEPLRKLKR